MDEAPQTRREIIQHEIAMHLFAMRGILNVLIATRLSDLSDIVDDEEQELASIRQGLEFLLSDIVETRKQRQQQKPKLKVVQ